MVRMILVAGLSQWFNAKVIIYWLLAFSHESYCTRYWEQVAINERWVQLLIEQTKRK